MCHLTFKVAIVPLVDIIAADTHFRVGLQVECYRVSRYKIKWRDVSAPSFPSCDSVSVGDTDRIRSSHRSACKPPSYPSVTVNRLSNDVKHYLLVFVCLC